MTSLRERMRENRKALAEIAEIEDAVARAVRDIPEAAHGVHNELLSLAATARQLRASLTGFGWLLLPACFFAGLGGAAAVLFLGEWIGSLFR